MKLTVRPLTPDLWPALEDLFGKNGACNGCWCMYWRLGSAYKNNASNNNKMAFRRVVNQGPPPGLLAFDGALAVGWCQLTPRSALPWMDRTWRLKRVDQIPVWLLSCLYVRIGYRERGVTSRLIQAALRSAKRARARTGSLPSRCRQVAECIRHRISLNVCARWIQNRCLPNSSPAHHALRLQRLTFRRASVSAQRIKRNSHPPKALRGRRSSSRRRRTGFGQLLSVGWPHAHW
jgi:hypothetical protein